MIRYAAQASSNGGTIVVRRGAWAWITASPTSATAGDCGLGVARTERLEGRVAFEPTTPGLPVTVSAVRLCPSAPAKPEIPFNVPRIVYGLGPFCIGEQRLT
jgi:hypothetical protein